VIDPKQVMVAIADDAREAGIELLCGGTLGAIDVAGRALEWSGAKIGFGHVVNTAGLHADTVAHAFGVGGSYTMLPFKGIYWKLDPAAGIRVNHLIYPVPDLRVPFLGIHTTTARDGTVTLGPTAIPAFGRESYRGLDDIGAGEGARIAAELATLFLAGKEGFRRLAWQEGQRAFRPAFARAARALLPRLRPEHLLPSAKVGMRAQLLDKRSGALVNDFLVETGPTSTHVLNAVSPAFTSALPFARFVCDTNIVS
jgi:L-2-hydroxyglutarate oxidase LhgO